MQQQIDSLSQMLTMTPHALSLPCQSELLVLIETLEMSLKTSASHKQSTEVAGRKLWKQFCWRMRKDLSEPELLLLRDSTLTTLLVPWAAESKVTVAVLDYVRAMKQVTPPRPKILNRNSKSPSPRCFSPSKTTLSGVSPTVLLVNQDMERSSTPSRFVSCGGSAKKCSPFMTNSTPWARWRNGIN